MPARVADQSGMRGRAATNGANVELRKQLMRGKADGRHRLKWVGGCLWNGRSRRRSARVAPVLGGPGAPLTITSTVGNNFQQAGQHLGNTGQRLPASSTELPTGRSRCRSGYFPLTCCLNIRGSYRKEVLCATLTERKSGLSRRSITSRSLVLNALGTERPAVMRANLQSQQGPR